VARPLPSDPKQILLNFFDYLRRIAAGAGVEVRREPTSGICVDFVTTGDYNRPMKVVGIRQLKARLSEYVRFVKSGETVLVCEREEVVAELRPARRELPRGTWEDVLDSLAASGELTRASLPKGEWGWKAQGLGLPSGTAQQLLDEIRADR
jgi:antitoxin (DNA-binding transcriptional repressor) of toxin-antitoxin stability system